jgi:hypothetical protein
VDERGDGEVIERAEGWKRGGGERLSVRVIWTTACSRSSPTGAYLN